ncbi:hypothetical protein V6N13_068413 [Hibiscus sabdariffa]|uniref:NADP-dependent oxidoreductase domain-containing protein n=1 Tax=Hibiscus sabdariffa TaxID=183260 RepID=A0ABR2QMI5_9ROSI
MQVHHGGVETTAIEFKAGSTSERAWTCINTNIRAQCREVFDYYHIHAPARENEDSVVAAVDAFHWHLPRELLLPTALVEGGDHPNPLQ